MSENKTGKPELDRIKSSVFSRSLSMAKLTLNAGASLAGQGLSRMWENKDLRDEKWTAFLSGQAQALSKELGELKGSLMKAGQMLSVYGEHFLPPEVNQVLKSLQHESPPVKWEVLSSVIQSELSPERLQELEIDPKSTASASLGQVHKARRLADGQNIALKVQYPGVDKAIDSDLKAIRTLLNVLQVLPTGLETDSLFEEVREMLVQETDYESEARWTEKYRARVAGDSRFIVPQIFPNYSTKRILATSFEAGVRADDPAVARLSEERRHRLALNFLDLYFKEIFEWGLVQTDPHAGNYRIRLRPDGQDQIVLFDFGATREYPEEFLKPYRRLIKASVLQDAKTLEEVAYHLKFLAPEDDPRLKQMFQDLCFMIVEPFRVDHYDWKKTDLPQRTTAKALEIKNFHLRTPPREILFLDRKTGGVFIMMSMLGARIKSRDLIMSYLERA